MSDFNPQSAISNPQSDFDVLVPAIVSEAEAVVAIAIPDQATYELAGAKFLAATALEREIEAHHAPIIAAAHHAHKVACDAKNRLLLPLRRTIAILRPALAAWEREQELLRQAEQARIETELARQQEEQLESVIEQAEASGATPAQVEQIIAAPLPPVRAIAPRTYQRLPGLSSREGWRAEVVSLKELARAVADGRQPEELLLGLARDPAGRISSPALNALARAMKGGMNIPGVQAVSETGVVVRSK